MNDVGEPCAGEPHARFDRGPLARGTAHETGKTRKPRPSVSIACPDQQPAAYLTAPTTTRSGHRWIEAKQSDLPGSPSSRSRDGRSTRSVI
jgi:hypothetical protein